MRGSDKRSGELFSYVDLEQRVRPDHPLRAIRSLTDAALAALSADFAALYSGMGRPSIAPEMLLRAMLLQAFYSVRSERQLMERLEFDLLFRWFVGIGVDDAVWDHSTFSKNRDRLLAGEIAAKFLTAVLAQPRVKRLLSSEHFSVDGTLIEAWASMKSVKPKKPPDGGGTAGGGRNAPADFKGEKRSNETHRSTTDPDARLYRRGPGMEAKLCFIGHALMENRSGLIVDTRLTRVSGHAERLAALDMIERFAERPRAITLGGDKGYDAADFVEELRTVNVRPHVAQNTSGRRSAIDGRTTCHPGYAASQRIRKRIEEAFGWMKTIAGCARLSCAACPRSIGPSASRRRHTIWYGRRSCSRRRYDCLGRVPTDRPVADLRGGHLGSRLPRPRRTGLPQDRQERTRRICLRRRQCHHGSRIQPQHRVLQMERVRRRRRDLRRGIGRTPGRWHRRNRAILRRWRRRGPQGAARVNCSTAC
jgi:transposase